MGKQVNLLKALPKVKRDLASRKKVNTDPEVIVVAKKYGYDYDYGYGDDQTERYGRGESVA